MRRQRGARGEREKKDERGAAHGGGFSAVQERAPAAPITAA
jgi:hypothetical protein